MAPFSFQVGRKVFNEAIGCNFYSLFRPMQYKGKIPPYVNCNIQIRTFECKKGQGEAQKSSLRGCRARRSYKKSFLRKRSVSFLLKSHCKGNAKLTTKSQRWFRRNIRRSAKSQRDTAEIEGEEVQKTFLRGCRTYTAEIEGEEV